MDTYMKCSSYAYDRLTVPRQQPDFFAHAINSMPRCNNGTIAYIASPHSLTTPSPRPSSTPEPISSSISSSCRQSSLFSKTLSHCQQMLVKVWQACPHSRGAHAEATSVYGLPVCIQCPSEIFLLSFDSETLFLGSSLSKEIRICTLPTLDSAMRLGEKAAPPRTP